MRARADEIAKAEKAEAAWLEALEAYEAAVEAGS
jgi:hypothetical protein